MTMIILYDYACIQLIDFSIMTRTHINKLTNLVNTAYTITKESLKFNILDLNLCRELKY